jgi:hypothetical protein
LGNYNLKYKNENLFVAIMMLLVAFFIAGARKENKCKIRFEVNGNCETM